MQHCWYVNFKSDKALTTHSFLNCCDKYKNVATVTFNCSGENLNLFQVLQKCRHSNVLPMSLGWNKAAGSDCLCPIYKVMFLRYCANLLKLWKENRVYQKRENLEQCLFHSSEMNWSEFSLSACRHIEVINSTLLSVLADEVTCRSPISRGQDPRQRAFQ